MTDKRARLEPPDISEKGGLKGGQPQRSDERLFMQLFAFTNCTDVAGVTRQLTGAGFESVLYEDLNDPKGVALLTLSSDPNTFVDGVRPVLNTGRRPDAAPGADHVRQDLRARLRAGSADGAD
jgi:hypothetical protein